MMDSDEAIYAALCRGDLEAFDILYERHANRLFGFIRKNVSSEAIAEEVLQEVFLVIVRDRKLPAQVGSLVNLRAWLFQIARNQCFNHLRSKKREAAALGSTLQDERRPSSPHSAERQLESKQAEQVLSDSVSKLPTELAELYALRTNGLSYEEIASKLSLPLGTVKSRMHQLVQRLRAEVNV
jgi:RNA polymerase sigma-70 factor, ECF subfamily